MSAHCSAGAAATAAAAAAGAALGLRIARAFPLVASITDDPLLCQMQLYFVARLEPKRMRWNGDQVHTTRRKTRKQMCKSGNGVKSVYDSTREKKKKKKKETKKEQHKREKEPASKKRERRKRDSRN